MCAPAPTHPLLAKEGSGHHAAPLLSCKAPFIRGCGDFHGAMRPPFNAHLFLSLTTQNLVGLDTICCALTATGSAVHPYPQHPLLPPFS